MWQGGIVKSSWHDRDTMSRTTRAKPLWSLTKSGLRRHDDWVLPGRRRRLCCPKTGGNQVAAVVVVVVAAIRRCLWKRPSWDVGMLLSRDNKMPKRTGPCMCDGRLHPMPRRRFNRLQRQRRLQQQQHRQEQRRHRPGGEIRGGDVVHPRGNICLARVYIDG